MKNVKLLILKALNKTAVNYKVVADYYNLGFTGRVDIYLDKDKPFEFLLRIFVSAEISVPEGFLDYLRNFFKRDTEYWFNFMESYLYFLKDLYILSGNRYQKIVETLSIRNDIMPYIETLQIVYDFVWFRLPKNEE